MSVYHTPEAFGYEMVGQVVWADTPQRYHVTAVFVGPMGWYSWGTDQGSYGLTAHPFAGWEPCDLETGTARAAAEALCVEAVTLTARGHHREVDSAAEAVSRLCELLGLTWTVQPVMTDQSRPARTVLAS